ncbi:MAG: hypothetical protein CAF43_007550 [Nitrospira sp. CG24C]|nr:MAG: hypothetical protein CAF43_007550 [Nitrospira sp. CG24C]
MSNSYPLPQSKDAVLAENLKKHGEQLEEENRLLLLQLHQVEEELERYYLLNQQNEKRLVELSELVKSTPSTAKEEQSRLAAERQQHFEKLTQARDAEAKLAADRQGQLEQAGRYLVYLVCLVCLVKPDRPDEPDKQNKPV